MNKIFKNAQGFSPVAGLLAVVVVVIVVASGVLVYKVHHKNNVKNDSTTSSQSPKQEKTTNSSAQPAQTAQQYLDIKEWGVELPLSSTISDAYYVVPTGISLDQDGKPSGVILGLTSLNSGCGTVSADATGYSNNLGEIVRALPTDTDPVSGELYTKLDPAGTTIGGYYYGYTGGITSKTCAPSSTLQSVNSAFSTATEDAVSASSTASN